MLGWFKRTVNLTSLVNPFYLYCISFSLAIFVYLWGWSNLFPSLSSGLLLFLFASFILFILIGYKLKRKIKINEKPVFNPYLNDILFSVIVFLGIINVILMRYIPLFDRSQNYKEFGFPVIDPIFNTLSIFFSIFFMQSFLEIKKRRFLSYFFIILVMQVFLFRRSTIVWILISSILLLIFHYRKVNLCLILVALFCIPLFSYMFGLYGNYRSNLSRSFVINELSASESFIKKGLSHNHYISYLYFSSPLANLQKNINERDDFINKGHIKEFVFYSIIPESFTMRLEKSLDIMQPQCDLIHPELLVGTFFMTGFCSLGWLGMSIMLLYLLIVIIICLWLSDKWNIFRLTTLCILSTTVSLQIFSNFLNRLDVIVMLFVYPVVFHFVYSKRREMTAQVTIDQ
jgi:hypothetical protein